MKKVKERLKRPASYLLPWVEWHVGSQGVLALFGGLGQTMSGGREVRQVRKDLWDPLHKGAEKKWLVFHHRARDELKDWIWRKLKFFYFLNVKIFSSYLSTSIPFPPL